MIQRERFGEHKLACTNRILQWEILPFASHKLKPISFPSHPEMPDGNYLLIFNKFVPCHHLIWCLLGLICSICYPLGLKITRFLRIPVKIVFECGIDSIWSEIKVWPLSFSHAYKKTAVKIQVMGRQDVEKDIGVYEVALLKKRKI